jgi:hypothetical protein
MCYTTAPGVRYPSALSLMLYSGFKSACDGAEPMKKVQLLYEA